MHVLKVAAVFICLLSAALQTRAQGGKQCLKYPKTHFLSLSLPLSVAYSGGSYCNSKDVYLNDY